ncbi:hypothetical protein [Streptomyces cucumeris]|uniref:hypothetical protein n=1 Tax=Streptomyces cucumeris TaxID=2962890 RepID=UPI0020C873B2|nr:hypothetical protein [Streptomyces sp. NEAU-Y11]MCP9209612.1 hypothetical protein [Streptomyces sp. NEAU-Y11]
MEWLRPEFKDREDLLETRAEFEKRTGVTKQSLSSHFTRYADLVPDVVKKFGKQKWFLASELDDFIAWISANTGTRSEADIKRAEIARLTKAIEEAEERENRHKAHLEKAQADKTRHMRQRKHAESDLSFLEQGS